MTGFRARTPARGTQPVRAQRLEHAQRLFDAAAYIHMTHDQIADLRGGTNDKGGSLANAFLLVEDFVGSANAFIRVAQQGIVDASQLDDPVAMGIYGIDAYS